MTKGTLECIVFDRLYGRYEERSARRDQVPFSFANAGPRNLGAAGCILCPGAYFGFPLSDLESYKDAYRSY